MKTFIAAVALSCSPLYAGASEYIESPFVEASEEGQAHYTVVQQKSGSGCVDCSLLFISYNGVRMVERSLSDKVLHDLFPKGTFGGDKGYAHFGVLFQDWDISHNKLYLQAYGNQAVDHKPPDIERRVVYDLATHKVSFAK